MLEEGSKLYTHKNVAKLRNKHQHFLLGTIMSKVNWMTVRYRLLQNIVLFFLDVKLKTLRYVTRNPTIS